MVLFVGMLGGVVDPGGDAIAAACDLVFARLALPLTPAFVS